MTEQDVKHHEHPSNEPNNEKKNEKKKSFLFGLVDYGNEW